MATRGKTGRRNKAKTSWALRIVLIICAAFLFVKLVQLHVQIEEKQQQIMPVSACIRQVSASILRVVSSRKKCCLARLNWGWLAVSRVSPCASA